MTNSATSTKTPRPTGGTGFQAWHFFAFVSLVGATAVVMVSPRGSHPVALLVISAAVLAAGLVGIAISQTVTGFLSRGTEAPPLPPAARDVLAREKALVLRSIKELEFDKGMGKVSDEDYAAIMGRLRARALTLMRDLERTPGEAMAAAAPAASARAGTCRKCQTVNDTDARFCKNCGASLGAER
jgi:hypothetical protein